MRVGLGLTRWEMVRGVVLPYTRGGLIAAVLLGAGRALGEAIAVTQVIGNHRAPAVDLFDTGRHAREPDRRPVPGRGVESPDRVAVLPGLILLVISLIVNFVALLIVRRYDIAQRV